MASPFTRPPQPPSPSSNSNLPMLYYGLVVVGTAAVILAFYNLIIIRWCSARRRGPSPAARPNSTSVEISTRRMAENGDVSLLSSFKYKKEMSGGEEKTGGFSECVVCLSAFEEGEEIRKLPRCRHCFHAPCIDMWLFSHTDCPLCRTPVVSSSVRRCLHHGVAAEEESSREALRAFTASV